MRQVTLQEVAIFADLIGCALIRHKGIVHVVKKAEGGHNRYIKWESFISYWNKGEYDEAIFPWHGTDTSPNKVALSLPRIPITNQHAKELRYE